ncbi:cytosolic sulfotransferase 15-like [Durio zibethinus]|uniref:Sulfotransferase n=1 Tax=Durio zibethinus TaxID=66656 RepID=A0A6P5YUD3_DURZI|nr:cytosolic sulfotransferase 15-like [Durio zibethinus]
MTTSGGLVHFFIVKVSNGFCTELQIPVSTADLGFWFKLEYVKATMAIENHFKPLPSGIVLASFPTTGTTRLKALTLSLLGHYSILKPTNRVFNTHPPYSILPDRIEKPNCGIVYIASNPADTFVPLWHVYNKQFGTTISLEEAFDEFCQDSVPAGPYFNHVVEFWKEGKKMCLLLLTRS